jgi:hypothetical protein
VKRKNLDGNSLHRLRLEEAARKKGWRRNRRRGAIALRSFWVSPDFVLAAMRSGRLTGVDRDDVAAAVELALAEWATARN